MLANSLDSLHYTGASGLSGYDEVFAPTGEPRPHYAGYIEALSRMGAPEMNRRWDKSRRMIQEFGIHFRVYAEERSRGRAWKLDPIPLIITSAEWDHLEKGLKQRALLYNFILEDLYGPQRLLRDGLLPPELLFANPGYLRACHRLLPEGRRWLQSYAADLGRASDGTWWVITDRTQAPSGVGYTLENRLVLSRFFQEVFRDAHVERLTDFITTYRHMLNGLGGIRNEPSRVVLLSPGPLNELYYEHACLARFLGINLVEGEDLTVRNNRVYLKTLEGLHEIRVIVRRQDDDYCDPLELRGDSLLGVPGLVQAVRAGNVAVANSLGSGLVEAQGFKPFLPSLCRHYLGEDLLIPSLATWWCGQPREQQYVEEHFDELILRGAFPATQLDAVRGAELGDEARAVWLERLRQRPHLFAAQEAMTLSTMPVWTGERIVPRRLMLRTQVVADGANGYHVLPGGVARVAEQDAPLIFGLQRGESTKDTWILADKPLRGPTLLTAQEGPVTLRRAATHLPSRVAANFFWLGRYIERALGLVMIARLNLDLALEEDDPESSARAMMRGVLVGMLGMPPEALPGTSQSRMPVEQLVALGMYSTACSGSLWQTLDAVHRAARAVSDRLSNDCRRLLNRMEADFTAPDVGSEPTATDLGSVLRGMVTLLSAFAGLAADSMTRSLSWRFLEIGRSLERGLYHASLLRQTLVFAGESDLALLQAVLDATDSGVTYRSRYANQFEPVALIDLLVLDDGNPRSIAFQLNRLVKNVSSLPRNQQTPGPAPHEKLALELQTRVRLATAYELDEPGPNGSRAALDALLWGVIQGLYGLSDHVARIFFSHAEAAHALRTMLTSPPELDIASH